MLPNVNGFAFVLGDNGIAARGIAPAVTALVDAATVAVNAALGNEFTLLTTAAVGATRALGAPTNPTAGQVLNFRIKQAAAGGPFALTYNAIWKFPGGIAPVLSVAANAVDRISAVYNTTDNVWDATFAKGFA